MGLGLHGALVPHQRWDPPARPPGLSPLAYLLRFALPCPTLSPWLLLDLKCQWFLSSTVGWQRFSEFTEKGFVYGKLVHTGNQDLTCTVCRKSRGAMDLPAKVLPVEGKAANAYRPSAVCFVALPEGGLASSLQLPYSALVMPPCRKPHIS